jgi:Histidine kinase-like ATPase domain
VGRARETSHRLPLTIHLIPPPLPGRALIPTRTENSRVRTRHLAVSPPPDQRPPSPHIARHTIRTALLGHAHDPELTDTAELLTSELVSNSVKHSDGPVTVRLRSHLDAVRIGVMDNHPDLPDPLPRTPDQAFGRGLYLVETLADAWGRYPVISHSRAPGWKVVWFELSAVRE